MWFLKKIVIMQFSTHYFVNGVRLSKHTIVLIIEDISYLPEVD